jgi:hypothetical protein
LAANPTIDRMIWLLYALAALGALAVVAVLSIVLPNLVRRSRAENAVDRHRTGDAAAGIVKIDARRALCAVAPLLQHGNPGR